MTPQVHFERTCAGLPGTALRVSRESRATVLDLAKRRCALCGEPATATDFIVSASAGGSASQANLLATCDSCLSQRGGCDLLEFAESRGRTLSEALQRARWDALALSASHGFVPAARRSRNEIRRWLEGNRWAFPRKVLHVGIGFDADTVLLAAAERRPSGYTFGLLLNAVGRGGQWIEQPRSARVPVDRWPATAEWLIDHHVHLLPVLSSPAMQSVASQDWAKHFDGVAGIARR